MRRPLLQATRPRYPGVTLGAVLVLAAASCGDQAQAPDLRVMTFNLRYGTAPDGDDAWPLRRDGVIAVIRGWAPDLLGVQEALRFQLDEVAAAFPEYAELGVGREDGDTAGEYSAILYRAERLRPDTGGTFWLSDTPDVPGSTSWGNRITRICTWAVFRDRATGRRFAAVNVHLDHESQPSRERAVALVLERLSGLGHLPAVWTGDFNAGESNPAVVGVREGGFRDTFRERHPDARFVGTFNGFRADSTGEKIDYVFIRGPWDVIAAAIVRERPGGRDASDHFAVTAAVRVASR